MVIIRYLKVNIDAAPVAFGSLLSVLGIFLALFIVSCEDDDHAHEEEHVDAEGFI